MNRILDFLMWVASSIFLACIIGLLAGLVLAAVGFQGAALAIGPVTVASVVFTALMVRGEHG